MTHKSVAKEITVLGIGCTLYQEIWVVGALLKTFARLIEREFWDWVLAPQPLEFIPVEGHGDSASPYCTYNDRE